MRLRNRHIATLISAMLAMVLTTACNMEECPDETEPTMLSIYVYSPESPLLTRADVGNTNATTEENDIKTQTLKIWVFRHDNGQLVAYYAPQTVSRLNSQKGDTYLLAVSDEIARERPNVDVYVMANVTANSCGISYALNEQTSRDVLDAAMFGPEHFGVTTLTGERALSNGLPMTGVLKDQPIYGENPVLRIGNAFDMATVKLVRAVSKLRFVFCKAAEDNTTVNIQEVTLDGGLIPKQEYLFLSEAYNRTNVRIGSVYESAQAELVPSTESFSLVSNEDPLRFVYTVQNPADYEASINAAVAADKLTEKGPYYFRETDRRLSGKIRYRVGDGAQKEATFTMANTGDFSRNHQWIVYAYYSSTGTLDVGMVDINDWKQKGDEQNPDIYNW